MFKSKITFIQPDKVKGDSFFSDTKLIRVKGLSRGVVVCWGAESKAWAIGGPKALQAWLEGQVLQAQAADCVPRHITTPLLKPYYKTPICLIWLKYIYFFRKFALKLFSQASGVDGAILPFLSECMT